MTLNDRLLGTAALLLAVFLTWHGYDLEAPFAYEPVGPKAFPLLLAAVIGLCGLRLVVKGGHAVAANPAGANLRIAVMVGLIAGYALLFQWLGFVLATTAMATLVGRLFGGTWGRCVIGGVALGVTGFVLFDKVMDVVLPVGLLGDLL